MALIATTSIYIVLFSIGQLKAVNDVACTRALEGTCGAASHWIGLKCETCIAHHLERIRKGLANTDQCIRLQIDNFCLNKHGSTNLPTFTAESCAESVGLVCGSHLKLTGPKCDACTSSNREQISLTNKGPPCKQDDYDNFCWVSQSNVDVVTKVGGSKEWSKTTNLELDDDPAKRDMHERDGKEWGVAVDVPVITVIGANPLHYVFKESSNGDLDVNFQDPGAVCMDPKEGHLDVQNAIEDMDTVGSHYITYRCVNRKGQKASPVTRTIISTEVSASAVTLPPTPIPQTDPGLQIDAGLEKKGGLEWGGAHKAELRNVEKSHIAATPTQSEPLKNQIDTHRGFAIFYGITVAVGLAFYTIVSPSAAPASSHSALPVYEGSGTASPRRPSLVQFFTTETKSGPNYGHEAKDESELGSFMKKVECKLAAHCFAHSLVLLLQITRIVTQKVVMVVMTVM